MKEDNRKWYKKKRFLIPIISISGFIILFIALGIIGWSSLTDEEKDQILNPPIEENIDESMDDIDQDVVDDPIIDNEDEVDTQDKVYPEIKARQEYFNNLVEKINLIEDPSVKAAENYNTLASTSNDANELYNAAKEGKNAAEQSWQDFDELDINLDIFEQDTSVTIEYLIEDLSSKYFAQREGFRKIMDYIDSEKPSDLDEAQSQFELANQFNESASMYILDIKSDLGLTQYE